MKKIIAAAIILVIAAGVGWYFFMRDGGESMTDETTQEAGPVVATVNGEEISSATLEIAKGQIASAQGASVASLDAATLEQLESSALDTLIGQMLIQQAVTNAGTKAPKADVDARIAGIKGQFADEAAFQAELSKQGTNLEALTVQIEKDLAIQTFLATTLKLDGVTFTEEEVKAEYEKAIAGVETPPAFEDARAEVETFILQQKQQALLNAYVQELRGKANIEIL